MLACSCVISLSHTHCTKEHLPPPFPLSLSHPPPHTHTTPSSLLLSLNWIQRKLTHCPNGPSEIPTQSGWRKCIDGEYPACANSRGSNSWRLPQ